MKLYLDDIRNPSSNGWVIVRNAIDCIIILDNCFTNIEEISFDHDLGDDYTGYDVAKFIEEKCFNGAVCPKWNIHSANPVGRKNIESAMLKAEKYSKGEC